MNAVFGLASDRLASADLTFAGPISDRMSSADLVSADPISDSLSSDSLSSVDLMSASLVSASLVSASLASDGPAGAVADPISLISDAARSFAALLRAQRGVWRLPDPVVPERPGLRWRNLLLAGEGFRRAHIEELSVHGRLAVLHVCVFPHLDDPAPVFGFDLVGGPSRVTGVFVDFSPVLEASSERSTLRLGDVLASAEIDRLGERRVVPPWGGIFSDDFVALRPHGLAEVARLGTLGQAAMVGFLNALAPGTAPGLRAQIIAGQNRYGAAMRQNTHTLRMLASLIGSDVARRFIDGVLFPPVPPADTSCADLRRQ